MNSYLRLGALITGKVYILLSFNYRSYSLGNFIRVKDDISFKLDKIILNLFKLCALKDGNTIFYELHYQNRSTYNFLDASFDRF